MAFRRLIEYYTQRWHGHFLDSGRCYHYKYLTSMLNVEQYLCFNIPLKFKTVLANFRCSNTKFQKELGRQVNIDIHNRLCTYCLINDN